MTLCYDDDDNDDNDDYDNNYYYELTISLLLISAPFVNNTFTTSTRPLIAAV